MKRHDSMRGWVAYELYQQMKKNKDIILITGDLGYLMFDSIKEEMPDQFLNTGAAEQAMMDIAVGVALSGKIPVVYSITPFLLYRPFETIRTYINHEKIPVIMLGGGRDDDYEHDGFSHFAGDDKQFMKLLSNIKSRWPIEKEDAVKLLQISLKGSDPYYINLRR
jgi:transketolase